jgi:glycosyltransferase involved in cell wall biosynthesis
VSGGQGASRQTTRVRIAYLVSHPIQYQAPLLRLIAAQPDFDLTVFFQSDISVREYHDPGFGQAVKWDVDLLHGYGHWFLPRLDRKGEITRFRPISYGIFGALRGGRFDVLWVHGYARWFNLLAIVVARLLGIAVVLRDEATATSAARSPAKTLLKRFFFAGLGRLVGGFLAIGSRNRRYYEANGIAADRIFDVPYCVDNDAFRRAAQNAAGQRAELIAALGLDEDRLVILFASKFQARKRPDELLEAYIRLTSDIPSEKIPYLLFVGNGELHEALDRRAAEADCQHVMFLGFKNQSELPRYFDLCDVLVLPSIHEPWGLIVNEAMNAGRIVIATDQVGCGPDLIKDGENGFVYPAGDIAALTEILRSLVTMDGTKRDTMGNRSLEIISRWNFERDVAGLRAAIESVASPPHRRTASAIR